MKTLLSSMFLLISLSLSAQVCVTLDDWVEVSDNGDGTCTYDITVTVDSGNGASGTATFTLNGTQVYEELNCICNPTTLTFPITVICGSTIDIMINYDAPGNGNDCSGSTGGVMLPVEWVDVSIKHVNNHDKIEWTVVENSSNNKYIIEESLNSIDYRPIGEVKNSTFENKVVSYSFYQENNSLETKYYRIKQIDFDGNYSLSEVISISSRSKEDKKVYPNPFSSLLIVEGAENGKWNISNTIGKTIITGEGNEINLPDLPSGLYLLTFLDNGLQTTTLITKQ